MHYNSNYVYMSICISISCSSMLYVFIYVSMVQKLHGIQLLPRDLVIWFIDNLDNLWSDGI